MHTSGCSRCCCLVYCAIIASLSPIACRLVFLFHFVLCYSFFYSVEQLPSLCHRVNLRCAHAARTESYLSLVSCTFQHVSNYVYNGKFWRRINRSLHITIHMYGERVERAYALYAILHYAHQYKWRTLAGWGWGRASDWCAKGFYHHWNELIALAKLSLGEAGLFFELFMWWYFGLTFNWFEIISIALFAAIMHDIQGRSTIFV